MLPVEVALCETATHEGPGRTVVDEQLVVLTASTIDRGVVGVRNAVLCSWSSS